jgi:endonuclease/exonuclease/phosphatase family metal-dependent hydrolase
MELSLLWYNAENLFHPGNDSLPVDDEFTPGGLRHWTPARYRLKLGALAKVIIAAGGWEPPDLVGLCEIEDEGVLKDLVLHPLLRAYRYAYMHCNSPDHRGLDVACLYRPDKIRIHSWRTIPSKGPADGTRDLFHACLLFGREDTLDLFLVHLVSKYRGAGATADLRRQQAQQLQQCMDSVHVAGPGHLVLAAGDFNDDPGSYSLEPLHGAVIGEDTIRDLVPGGPVPHTGTYKYRGRWSHLDQVRWCGPADRYELRASVLALPSLLVRDEEYGGWKPFRTYRGYRYQGGISDHLPLLVQLRPGPSRSPSEP